MQVVAESVDKMELFRTTYSLPPLLHKTTEKFIFGVHSIQQSVKDAQCHNMHVVHFVASFSLDLRDCCRLNANFPSFSFIHSTKLELNSIPISMWKLYATQFFAFKF